MINLKKKQRILIVDDAVENIDIIVALLADEYSVSAARNGHKALEMIFKNPPDLILLDVVMPAMDGYELCTRIKGNDNTKDIPIIFVTAMNNPMDEVKAFNHGAIDYITKPFQPVVVKTRIRTHLNLKEKTDLLEKLVSLDGLTGIHNRRKFDEILPQEWNRASRSGEWLSLFMIDVDYFKAFNDHYGHTSGDECLIRIARALNDNMYRPSDFLARYGGEEFVVLLPGTQLSGALQVAEQLRAEVAKLNIAHEYSQAAAQVTVSIGVVTTRPQSQQQSTRLFIDAADNMLYKSKDNGRNQVNGTEL